MARKGARSERIFDDMNNGFGWNRLPKSFMGENTVFLLLTALIRNFYKFIMARLDVKRFGRKHPTPIAIQLHPQCLLGIQSILRNWTFLIFKQV